MAFSATNTYASLTDIRQRITRTGAVWAGDVDTYDGQLDASELAYLEQSVEWANTLIDAAICNIADIAPRPANSFLNSLCIDLAVYRFYTLGGREAGESFKEDYRLARETLELIRQGSMTVPGLDLGTETADTGRVNDRMPEAVNPHRNTSHRPCRRGY